MPKDYRKRSGLHQSSVKLLTPSRAPVADEHGSPPKDSHADLRIPGALSADDLHLSKKDRQKAKREALLERFEHRRSLYSKSHGRRLKRKAKEQLAGGFGDIQSAIAALDKNSKAAAEAPSTAQSKQKLSTPESLQIGRGKSSTLSDMQRKKALKLEQLRHPLILSNKQFTSNPFESIRIHAENSLLRHENFASQSSLPKTSPP